MEEAFVIMQIGNPQLDILWKEVYQPALKECGLDPKRIDKHEEGRLLNSEIAEFIKRAKIIIADLTNERPNCYLEVGYAMGSGKFRNLILCAREDHHVESLHYIKGEAKVHFDLSGYSFSWWTEDKLEDFKRELIGRVRRRLKSLIETNSNTEDIPQGIVIADKLWVEEARREVSVPLHNLEIKDVYEVIAWPQKKLPNLDVKALLRIAEKAKVSLSGWPIGVVLHNEHRPRPELDGINAKITSEDLIDHWALKGDGRFYFLRGGEEDRRFEGNKKGKYLYVDNKIRRITETLIYLNGLYRGFGMKETDVVEFSLTHTGLERRTLNLMDSNRMPIEDNYECLINEVHSTRREEIGILLSNIKDIVLSLSNEVFGMFDYYAITKGACDDIIDKFISRRS